MKASFVGCRFIPATFCLLLAWELVLVSCDMAGKDENHNLLKSIGLQKVRMPTSHYRKRLAVDARHYSRSDDSHMFVIKLPPNPHYYVHNRPDKTAGLIEKKKAPVTFQANGKPKRIYHWNIPVMKKIASQRTDTRLLKDKAFNNVLTDKYLQMTNVYQRKIPTYYVPVPVKQKKTSFHKYFAGNGKPHSFYVIEKSKKSHPHKLLV